MNTKRIFPAILLLFSVTAIGLGDEPVPGYNEHVAPLLTKYCAGCHNADDREGDFSLETYAELQKGGESGVAILPGDAASSRLIRLLTGAAEPKMPPEGEPAPTAAELSLLKAWIEAGAKGPDGAEPDRTLLRTPQLPAVTNVDPAITGLAWSPAAPIAAVARFGKVELISTKTADDSHEAVVEASSLLGDRKPIVVIGDLPGKVNAVEFSRHGTLLVTASGVAGLYGHAAIWNTIDGTLLREFKGHRDILYAATLQPNGSLLATAGYDRRIDLWDIETGELVRSLSGHNDAVYDLAFSPDGTVLASASGDHTVKLWHVETGERLDTLSQPLAEQYVVEFSPDGRSIVAGGADNRIRVWQFVSRTAPRINPLIHARFAHEGPIVQLAFSPDGRSLITLAEDRSAKQWETTGFTQVRAFPEQPDVAVSLAISNDGDRFLVGRMDGSLARYSIKTAIQDAVASQSNADATPLVTTPAADSMNAVEEQEPNDSSEQSQLLELPAIVRGVIQPLENQSHDADVYRFRAKAGEQWIAEIKAARDKSPLDSKLEILDADENRITRVMLQAVRDSYFTFRGKDSDTSDDFRVHNWQEMELNEYLYAAGEVVKLWLYPRGPDSGFKVYPGQGKRTNYFDTTAYAHALGAPCYIVRPVEPGQPLIPNGLPVFPIYYENDDDSLRRWGADSRLTFTAPADGEYLVRVTDVRGFGGDNYKYELTVRPRHPDFRVTLHGANPSVPAGAGRELRVTAERMDGYDGPIEVHIDGLPPGFHATSPIVIQSEQIEAFGAIYADADAVAPTADQAKSSQVTAHAMVDGQLLTKPVNNLGEIKLAAAAKLGVRIVADDISSPAEAASLSKPLELTIHPGETITARVLLDRLGHNGPVSFGKEDSGRNLPHGVFVDNIGLNGLLILPGQDERQIFITAAKWVPEQTRLFHLKTEVEGGVATLPVLLRVVNGE
ncbi:MAG: c-type cytochrome domain-containing protein [Pirellulaceae bacterium]